jgi:hypothetical protein
MRPSASRELHVHGELEKILSFINARRMRCIEGREYEGIEGREALA